MRSALLTWVWLLVLGVSDVQAQKLLWEQPSSPALMYDLVVAPGATQQVMALAQVTCQSTKTAQGFPCEAPIPATIKSTTTLAIIAKDAAGNRSAMSNVVTFDVTPTTPPINPDCAFPTGKFGMSLFPTRLLHGGTRAVVQFQLSSPNSPVTRLDALLETNGVKTPAATLKGENLADVGAMWFVKPTAPGTYRVFVQATNAANCVLLTSTVFTVVVQ